MAPSEKPRSKAYRDRAEECRALAARFHGPATRGQMLKLAQEFDRMALQVSALELQLADLEAAYRGDVVEPSPPERNTDER